VYLASAPKQTDAEERDRRYLEAVNDYQKAIDLKAREPATIKEANPKTSSAKNSNSREAATPAASSTEELAGYYNNLAHAEAKSGKLDDAVKSYNQAIQLDPAGAAQFYYNLGAILMNAGKNDEAIEAFDKSIAADPAKPDAYYQKGASLIAKATTDKNGKIVALPGTQEALSKYLELAPNGQFAEAAKGMIQYIGATVETNYNHPKKK
jgi:tetratricopeptide (TPR) repeat protein